MNLRRCFYIVYCMLVLLGADLKPANGAQPIGDRALFILSGQTHTQRRLLGYRIAEACLGLDSKQKQAKCGFTKVTRANWSEILRDYAVKAKLLSISKEKGVGAIARDVVKTRARDSWMALQKDASAKRAWRSLQGSESEWLMHVADVLTYQQALQREGAIDQNKLETSQLRFYKGVFQFVALFDWAALEK